MPALRVLTPCLTAALAAWVTRGTLAVADARGPRLGALPPFLELGLFIGVALLLVFVARPAPARVRPLYLSALLLLPWLPVPLPAAALIWTGPGMTLLVWMAVATCVAVTIPWRRGTAAARAVFGHPRRAPVLAGAIAFTLFLAAASRLSAFIPGGDEPHYLIIAQSLLSEGDLRIEDNHARGDYAPYFDGVLKPDFLRRGRNGAIYSIHAPGLPLLIAPAYALGGHAAVVIWLGAFAALGSALVWRLAWTVAESAVASWIAWAGVVLSPPFFFHAFTVYPDGVAAVLTLVALSALVHGRDTVGARHASPLHGIALAFLPWLHTRYAIISLVLGIAIVWQHRRNLRSVAWFAAVPIISAILWFAFFYNVYGTVSPAAPYGGYTQSSPSFILTGLPGLVFDQQFGIITHAPVYAIALLGLGLLWRRSPFVVAMIVAVAIPYLLLAGAYRMWWGGWSAPARFIVPVTLMFALPLASAWRDARTARGRPVVIAALFLSLFVTAVLTIADQGALLYNTRTGEALWLNWLGPLVDLSAAAPSFIRDTRWVAIGHTAIWKLAVAVSFAMWRWVVRRQGSDTAVALAFTIAAALTMATTAVWAVRGVDPVAPTGAQTTLLRAASAGSAVFVVLNQGRGDLVPAAALRRVSREDLLRSLRIGSPRDGNSDDLLRVPSLPGGRYRVHLSGRRAASGRIEAHVGRRRAAMPPVAVYDFEGQPPGPTRFEIDLATDVTNLVITGDATARQSIAALSLEPVAVFPPSGIEADAAIRYGQALVSFGSSKRLYPEPAGFWIGPREDVVFSVQSAAGAVRLMFRNAPVPNRVSIDLPSGTHDVTLQPEETWTTPALQGSSSIVVKVRADAGFRPAERDPRTGDRRWLAVWVSVVPTTPP